MSDEIEAPPARKGRAGFHATGLAVRHLAAHRGQAVVLGLVFGLALFLPVAAAWLNGRTAEGLRERAEQTPLVLGAAGPSADLVLNAVYFRAPAVSPVLWDELQVIAATELAQTLPIHARYAVRGQRVVGTHLAPYVELRQLRLASGTIEAKGMEAVLGATAAQVQGLGLGDRFLPDGGMVETAAPRPQLLTVVGILAPSGTADDDAVFVNVATPWILADRLQAEPLPHESLQGLTLTAVLVLPPDDLAATRLRALIRTRPGVQLVSPAEVIGEVLGPVLRVDQRLSGYTALAGWLGGLLLVLGVALQVRLRRRERTVLEAIGAGRIFVVRTLAAETALLLLAGLIFALVGLGLLAVG